VASLLNKNVFSNRLNWPYDSPHSLRFSGRLLQTCGPAAANDLAPKLKTAARPTDHECLSVGRILHGRWRRADTNTRENLGTHRKEIWGTREREPTLPLYLPNSEYDEELG